MASDRVTTGRPAVPGGDAALEGGKRWGMVGLAGIAFRPSKTNGPCKLLSASVAIISQQHDGLGLGAEHEGDVEQ